MPEAQVHIDCDSCTACGHPKTFHGGERMDHNSAETLLDSYIRKTLQSERDSDWITATERRIALSKNG
jgi:hypothetical protein